MCSDGRDHRALGTMSRLTGLFVGSNLYGGSWEALFRERLVTFLLRALGVVEKYPDKVYLPKRNPEKCPDKDAWKGESFFQILVAGSSRIHHFSL